MPLLAVYLFLGSLLCMAVLIPVSIRVGRRWGVLDQPGPRKIHATAVPLTGGWALFGAISLVLWGHLLGALAIRGTALESQLPELMRYYIRPIPELILKILPVYGGALLIFALGVFDDVKGMSVRSRLLVQVIIAAGLVGAGIRPSLGFLPSWLGAAVGILWIVGITNAFNFLDGLDGLSGGVALVAAVALLTIMGYANQPQVANLLSVLAGTLFGFLCHNWHPARIFLGSSGSLLIGYLLSVSTIVITFMPGQPDNWLMPLLTPIFVLAIPLYDTTSVVLIRLLQKRNIAIGDQSHFHHRLLKLGFSQRQTAAFIILIAFSVALSGVRLVNATLGQSFLILVQIVVIMSILILAERVASRIRTEFHERREEPPVAVTNGSRDDDPLSPP